MKTSLLALSMLSVAVIGLGCHQEKSDMHAGGHEHMHHEGAAGGKMQPMMHAIAVLHGTKGNDVHGTVKFTQEGDAVMVVADIMGLAPNSSHGFHIHEFGDCSAPDASSAGGHYNPEGHQHGTPGAEHHAGDMGNVQANEQGNVHVEMTLANVSVNGHHNAIMGRSVILHAKADDLKSQPSGEAGGRIACGVIGAAK